MLERMMPFTTNRSVQYLKGLEEEAKIYDDILRALKEATHSVRHIHRSKIEAMLPNRGKRTCSSLNMFSIFLYVGISIYIT